MAFASIEVQTSTVSGIETASNNDKSEQKRIFPPFGAVSMPKTVNFGTWLDAKTVE